MGIGNRTRARIMKSLTAAHYPSWGSETPASIGNSAKEAYSLPLMGIGNRIPQNEGRWRSDYSLPLMGIGNQKMKLSVSSKHPTHYPSWGSETALAWVLVRSGGMLITPHGDRKLPSRPTLELPTSDLITPHGDRKLSTSTEASIKGWELITPHGDRKPSGCRAGCPGSRATHYPSWGSETSSSALSQPSQ